jgi:hypothetical protein
VEALLKAAGVRDARLHDARHTAPTVLLILGVPERMVIGLMGWSTTSMASRYHHVTNPIRRDVAAQVGSLIWATDQPGLKQLRPKLRPEPTKPTISRLDWEVLPLVAAAEDAGFEPARACTQPAFQVRVGGFGSVS